MVTTPIDKSLLLQGAPVNKIKLVLISIVLLVTAGVLALQAGVRSVAAPVPQANHFGETVLVHIDGASVHVNVERVPSTQPGTNVTTIVVTAWVEDGTWSPAKTPLQFVSGGNIIFGVTSPTASAIAKTWKLWPASGNYTVNDGVVSGYEYFN